MAAFNPAMYAMQNPFMAAAAMGNPLIAQQMMAAAAMGAAAGAPQAGGQQQQQPQQFPKTRPRGRPSSVLPQTQSPVNSTGGSSAILSGDENGSLEI
jgi:hypothetical protein